MRIYTG